MFQEITNTASKKHRFIDEEYEGNDLKKFFAMNDSKYSQSAKKPMN